MEEFNDEMIVQMLDNKQFSQLKKELEEINTADIAEVIDELPIEKAVVLFRLLSKDDAADVFVDLYSETQQNLVEKLSDNEVTGLVNDMFSDDAADLIEEMPAAVAKKILAKATKDTRDKVNQLLKYTESSAGSIMTVEYVDLKKEMTVEQAFDRIRARGANTEQIYTCYVTDNKRKLEGVVSVRELLLANPSDKIGDIMETNVVVAHTDEDQEDVALDFEKYGFMAFPVVDSEERLVGIITVDDIVGVIQEENTEDIEKMGGMLPSEKPYLKTGVLETFKNRIGWLVLLMITGMGTGFILQGFEDAFTVVPLLVTFIPMLTDTGGNAGSQSSTMIIRGMALDEIEPKDFLKVAWKEVRVALIAGVVLSLISMARVYLLNWGEPELFVKASVISLTLIFTVFFAKLCGSMLPLLAKKVNIDPAVMAAPLITTIVDAGSLIVFFTIARMLLHI